MAICVICVICGQMAMGEWLCAFSVSLCLCGSTGGWVGFALFAVQNGWFGSLKKCFEDIAVQNGWFGSLKKCFEDIERGQGPADSQAVRHQGERQLGAVR